VAAELQPLEPRTLPAGTVTATLSAGSLTIGGDNLDNSIMISVRTEGVFLTGLQDPDSDPTTFTKIKFGSEVKAEGEEVQLTNAVSLKSLTIQSRPRWRSRSPGECESIWEAATTTVRCWSTTPR
jgi:hypothetical protein